jgi:transcriptional regulator with XRE-family HTH domain
MGADLTQEFSEALRAGMERRKLTQAATARIVGVSESSLSRYLAQRKEGSTVDQSLDFPRLPVVFAMARTFPEVRTFIRRHIGR